METASFGRRPEARLKVHYWAHYEVSSINVLGIDTIRHSKYLGRGFGNRRAGRKRSAIIRTNDSGGCLNSRHLQGCQHYPFRIMNGSDSLSIAHSGCNLSGARSPFLSYFWICRANLKEV